MNAQIRKSAVKTHTAERIITVFGFNLRFFLSFIFLFFEFYRGLALFRYVLRRQAVVFKQGLNLSASAEPVLNAYAQYRNGHLFADRFAYRGAETAYDIVLLRRYYRAGLFHVLV